MQDKIDETQEDEDQDFDTGVTNGLDLDDTEVDDPDRTQKDDEPQITEADSPKKIPEEKKFNPKSLSSKNLHQNKATSSFGYQRN